MKRKRGRIPIQIVDGCLPCSVCHVVKPVDQFYSGTYAKASGKRNHSIRACGFSSACKQCQRLYFRNNPEKQAKQSAQAMEWQRTHPEQWQVIRARRAAKLAAEKSGVKSPKAISAPGFGDSRAFPKALQKELKAQQQSGTEII